MTTTHDTNSNAGAAEAAATVSNESNSPPVAITPGDGESDGSSQVAKPVYLGERLAGLTGENAPDFALFRDQVVNTLRDWYVLASDSIANLLEGRALQEPVKDLWLLGRHYELGGQPEEQQEWGATGLPPK
ncbi:hypothetical protein GGI21_002683, partial [Coemansia aciculifera]